LIIDAPASKAAFATSDSSSIEIGMSIFGKSFSITEHALQFFLDRTDSAPGRVDLRRCRYVRAFGRNLNAAFDGRVAVEKLAPSENESGVTLARP